MEERMGKEFGGVSPPVPEVCKQGLAKETTGGHSALIQGLEGP